MPRPGDWDAIGLSSDPTPGDPDTINQLVDIFQHLGGKAREIYAAIEAVMNSADDSVFSGETADALRGKVDQRLRGHVEDVAWAFESAAGALRDWHGVVIEQQARADAALNAGRGLPEDDPERQRQQDIARQAGEYQAEQGRSVSGRIRSVSHIALPISACEIFWEAFKWLAIILIIPALVFGGPIALLALGVNLTLFIKTVVDFANGDASFLDLFLAGLGMIAPTTKALPIFSILKSVGSAVAGGAKAFFQGFKQIFSREFLFSRLLPGLSHLPTLASIAIRETGLLVVSGIKNLSGFSGTVLNAGGLALTGLTRLPGAIAKLPGAIGSGLAAGWQGAKNWFQLARNFYSVHFGGSKIFRILLPVDAGEIRAYGFWNALKIGVFNRGVLGQYRFGAPLPGTIGRTISAIPVNPAGVHTGIGDGFTGLSHVNLPPALDLGGIRIGADLGSVSASGFQAAKQIDSLDGIRLNDLVDVRTGDLGVSVTGSTTISASGLHIPATAGTSVPVNGVVSGLPTPGQTGLHGANVSVLPTSTHLPGANVLPGSTNLPGATPPAGATHLPGTNVVGVGFHAVPGEGVTNLAAAHLPPPAAASIGDLIAPSVRGATPTVSPGTGLKIGEGTTHGFIANQIRQSLDDLSLPNTHLSTTPVQAPTVDRLNAAMQLVDHKPAGAQSLTSPNGLHTTRPATPDTGLHTTRPATPDTGAHAVPSPGEAGRPAPNGFHGDEIAGAGSAGGGPLHTVTNQPVNVPVKPVDLPGHQPFPAHAGKSGLPGDAGAPPTPGRTAQADVPLQGVPDRPGLFVRVEDHGPKMSTYQMFGGGPNGRMDVLPGDHVRFTDSGTGQTFRFDPNGKLVDQGIRLTRGDGVLRLDDRVVVVRPDGSHRVTTLAGDAVPENLTVKVLEGGGVQVVAKDGVSWNYGANGRLEGQSVGATWEQDLAARAGVFRKPGDTDAAVQAKMDDFGQVRKAEFDLAKVQRDLDLTGPGGPSAKQLGDATDLNVGAAKQHLDDVTSGFVAKHGTDPDHYKAVLDDLLATSVHDRPRVVGGVDGVRRSGRATHQADQLQHQRVWNQDFGPSQTRAGATHVKVELGPGVDTPGFYGSKPLADQNTAVNELNAVQAGGHKWIKGHLWNDNLGGPGTSNNLTPMTHPANMAYQHAVERPLKDALNLARRYHEFGIRKDADFWLGVRFEAEKIGQAFPKGSAAEQAVGNKLNITSTWVKRPHDGGPAVALSADEVAKLPKLPAGGLPTLPNGWFDPVTGRWEPAAASVVPPAAPSGLGDDMSSLTSLSDDVMSVDGAQGGRALSDVSMGSAHSGVDDLPVGSVRGPADDVSVGSAHSIQQAMDADVAAHVAIFRRSGDSDLDVQARMDDFGAVQRAADRYIDLYNDPRRLDVRGEGSSTALPVGDQANLDLHVARQEYENAKQAFEDKHDLSVDEVFDELRELRIASVNDRPRGLGAGGPKVGQLPGEGIGVKLVDNADLVNEPPRPTGPYRTHAVPGHSGLEFDLQRGGVVTFRGADRDLFTSSAANGVLTVQKLADVGSDVAVHTWTFKMMMANGLKPVDETLTLAGGAFGGKTITVTSGNGGLTGTLDDLTGQSWPVKAEGDTITVATVDGPLVYSRTGDFQGLGQTSTSHLPAPTPPAGLAGDQLARWQAAVDLSRTHLTAATPGSKVWQLMDDVKASGFTGKRGYGGYVNPHAIADGVLDKLARFDEVTKDLMLQGTNGRTTVYRGVGLDPASAQADRFLERLPISTSNNLEFQHTWAAGKSHDNWVVFEIDVPPGHPQLAMSYPPGYHPSGTEAKGWNQAQWEVTLGPTTLVRTDAPVRIENGLTIIPVRAEQIPSGAVEQLVREPWPGLSSQTAFDDFAKAFQPEALRKFPGLGEVGAHSTLSPDGLINTVRVGRPGSADEMVFTVTRDPDADSVRVTVTSDGMTRLDQTWSKTSFRTLAGDLRGGTLHANETFDTLAVPKSWEQRFTAEDVFRTPGDSAATVEARMLDWQIVRSAQDDFAATKLHLDTHGGRTDGPSNGLSVGELARLDHAAAKEHLDLAKDAFRAKHGLDPDTVSAQLDHAFMESLKDRPRLVGGGGRDKSVGVPGSETVRFEVQGRSVTLTGEGADRFSANLSGTTLTVTDTVTEHSWKYSVGFGGRVNHVGESFPLGGGVFDGRPVSLEGKMGLFDTGHVLDGNGTRWPVRVGDDTLTVASPQGPLVYDKGTGAFRAADPGVAGHLPAPVPPPGLSAADAARWQASVDLSRTHLTVAGTDKGVENLMKSVLGGSFTSKRGYGGFVNPSALADGSLLKNVRTFERITGELRFQGPLDHVTVYRGVSMDPLAAQADEFVERLPISTSNGMEFQHEWAANGVRSNRVVFEIDVPPEHGKLAMAYPPKYEIGPDDARPWNQDQWEVTLAPTTLVRTGPTRVEDGLTIIPVRAEQIPVAGYDQVIGAKWEGLASETAFDDFARALTTDKLRQFEGLSDVSARSTRSADGLTNTVHVSRPGESDQLVITITRDPDADAVSVTMTADGAKVFDRNWSRTGFSGLATDLRGGVLHNNDLFMSLPVPKSWAAKQTVGDAWNSDLAARTKVFQRPGEPADVVAGRMDDFTDVQRAQQNFDAAKANFDLNGQRLDGPSSRPSVGEQARLDLHAAEQQLTAAKQAFEVKHGLQVDGLQQQLDDLLTTSVNDRPRLVGAGRPRTADVPGEQVRVTLDDGEISFEGAGADRFRAELTPDGNVVVHRMAPDGGGSAQSWVFQPLMGRGMRHVGDGFPLAGGTFDGRPVLLMRKGDVPDAGHVTDAAGRQWPARVIDDTVVVATPLGPQRYELNGSYLGSEPARQLPAAALPDNFAGDAQRWLNAAHVSRLHLTEALDKTNGIHALIRKVQTGSFTGHRGYGGFVKNPTKQLIEDTEFFHRATGDLLFKGPDGPITVYRSVDMDKASAAANDFVERLPSSTSQDLGFQVEWTRKGLPDNTYVFEIDVPAGHGKLAMSYPPGYRELDTAPPPLNQSQSEITLAPTKLVRTGPNKTVVVDGTELQVIPVRAEQIPANQLKQFVKEPWPGLPIETAYGDLVRAFDQQAIGNWHGFKHAQVRSATNADNTVTTLTVTRPGSADELTVTISRDPVGDTVSVHVAGGDRVLTKGPWKSTELGDIAARLRGTILHDSDEFVPLPRPSSWPQDLVDTQLPGGLIVRTENDGLSTTHQLVDAQGTPVPGRTVTVDAATGRITIEWRGGFERFAHTGDLLEQGFRVVRNGRPTPYLYVVDHVSGTWARTGDDATGAFLHGKIDGAGLENGRITLLSSTGKPVEVFERRLLPDGTLLDSFRRTDTLGFGRFERSSTWATYAPDGTMTGWGQRRFDTTGSGWQDVQGQTPIREYREGLQKYHSSTGQVLATKNGDEWHWYKFDDHGNQIADGVRVRETVGDGWKDTYTRTTEAGQVTEVAQQKWGMWHRTSTAGQYQEFTLVRNADGVLERPGTWEQLSRQGRESGGAQTVGGNGLLTVVRQGEQRPPVWIRESPIYGNERPVGVVAHLGDDHRFQLFRWEQTGTNPGSGMRYVGADGSTVDVAPDGTFVRSTGKLSDGTTLKVGDHATPPAVPHPDGGTPWEAGATRGWRITQGDSWTDVTQVNGNWVKVRESFAGGIVREYPDHQNRLVWFDRDAHGNLSGLSSKAPGTSGTGQRYVVAGGAADSAHWRWYELDAQGVAIPGREGDRLFFRGSTDESLSWDDSFRDFDAVGNLVRDRRMLDGGRYVESWQLPNGHWRSGEFDKLGVRVAGDKDLVRLWSTGDEWQQGWVRGSDHFRDVRPGRGTAGDEVFREVPLHLRDSPLRVREYQLDAAGKPAYGLWKEFDHGAVVRERKLSGQNYLETDSWRGQWKLYDADGRVIGERGHDGLVFEMRGDRLTLTGSEYDFRGPLTEMRGWGRRLREPQRAPWLHDGDWTFSGTTLLPDGNPALREAAYAPYLKSVAQKAMIEFGQEFLLEFTSNLIVNAIVAEAQGRSFTGKDALKALMNAGVSSTIKTGLGTAVNDTKLGGALRTFRQGQVNLDAGKHWNRRPLNHDRLWTNEWTGNESATRWRGGTYDFGFNFGPSLLSGFVNGTMNASIFGITTADGQSVKLSGWDAVGDGGINALASLTTGVSTALVKTVATGFGGSRFFHRQGFADFWLQLPFRVFEKSIQGIFLTSAYRASINPDWYASNQPPAASLLALPPGVTIPPPVPHASGLVLPAGTGGTS